MGGAVSLVRRTPLRSRARTTRTRVKVTGPTRTTREVVWARAGGRCELCGGSIAGVVGFSMHHRLPRRMGGSSRPELNTPANLILLCGSGTTGCHGRVESHREQAYGEGLLLREGQDPAAVPVLLAIDLVYLAVDGTYALELPDVNGDPA